MTFRQPLYLLLFGLAMSCSKDSNGSSGPNTIPTQLTKADWQIDLAYVGENDRLEATFSQNGGTLSGTSRDNNSQRDVVTTGTVVGSTLTARFVMSNGGSTRGEFTCTATIGSGSPQTVSGNFTSPDGSYLGAANGGNLTGTCAMQ